MTVISAIGFLVLGFEDLNVDESLLFVSTFGASFRLLTDLFEQTLCSVKNFFKLRRSSIGLLRKLGVVLERFSHVVAYES